ncbi:MAG: hypothetical protein AAFR52_00560 [Pseudomonadota bacterium]
MQAGITITAAGPAEAEAAATLVAAACAPLEAELGRPPEGDGAGDGAGAGDGEETRDLMEGAALVTLLCNMAAGVGTGIVANVIYDAIRSRRRAGGAVTRRDRDRRIEITDEASGLRIVITEPAGDAPR